MSNETTERIADLLDEASWKVYRMLTEQLNLGEYTRPCQDIREVRFVIERWRRMPIKQLNAVVELADHINRIGYEYVRQVPYQERAGYTEFWTWRLDDARSYLAEML